MKGALSILILASIATAWFLVPNAPPKHHQAAIGIWFLRDYYPITTSRGMVGWTPGQEVHQDMRAVYTAGARTVSDGTNVAVVPESALTQDIEDAEVLRLADASEQARSQAGMAATAERIARDKVAAQVAASSDINRSNAAMVTASTVGHYASALNEPRTAVGGSVGYYGYPVYVGSVSGGSVVSSGGSARTMPSGVSAGTAAANQAMAARAATAAANAARSTPPPGSASTLQPRTVW